MYQGAFLEHVNLNLPIEKSEVARDFFISVLGCTEDARPKQMGKEMRLLWADCGLQQFHLPLVHGSTTDIAPQRLRGQSTLALKNRNAIQAALNRIRCNPSIQVIEIDEDGGITPFAVRIQCPFGGVYRLVASEGSKRFLGGDDDSKGHPMNPHPSLSEEETVVGIKILNLFAPQKSLESIASFWKNSLHCDNVEIVAGSVVVQLNDSQQIIFEAREDIEDYDGHHLCLYLPKYEEAYRACEKLGIIYDPGRFSDRGGSWELAQEHKQFRVLHWPMITSAGYAHLGILQQLRPEDDDPSYTLELELRSLDHPSFPCKK